jgi:hypothetical protein
MVWRTKRESSGRLGVKTAWSRVAAACLLALCVVACGGSDDEDDEKQRKPDTGYGAGLSVPSPRTCQDLCSRLGDCAAALCNEDHDTTQYSSLEDILNSQCLASCDDSIVNSTEVTDAMWSCMFESSCREVFDYDECNASGSYYCD